jgi:hypothetical protein
VGYTQITAQWQGIPGAPGWTRLRFEGEANSSDATVLAGRVRSFFSSINSYLPATARISFPAVAQTFDDFGVLSGEVALSPQPATISGVGSGAYAGPSGVVVNWLTGVVADGRKLTGRTYLVPLTGCFDTDGTISSAAMSSILAAAQALAAGTPQLAVVQRRNGAYTGRFTITGAAIPDRACVLRSRRD